jgi:two-component system sensor histidine kinase VanS
LSVRLKLTLSYAGFLVLAGASLLALWAVLLQYFPHARLISDTRSGIGGAFAPGRSPTQRDFGELAVAVLAFLLVFGLLGGWLRRPELPPEPHHRRHTPCRDRIALPPNPAGSRNDEFRELADT